MGGGAFIPRFRNLKKEEKRNFTKGYCVIINSGGSAAPNLFAEYGESCRRRWITTPARAVSGSIFGERPARYENHVRINKTVSDAWGIPALHIEVKDGDNELNMAKDAANSIEELFHAAGWDIIRRPIDSTRRDTASTKWALAAWAIIQRPAC